MLFLANIGENKMPYLIIKYDDRTLDLSHTELTSARMKDAVLEHLRRQFPERRLVEEGKEGRSSRIEGYPDYGPYISLDVLCEDGLKVYCAESIGYTRYNRLQVNNNASISESKVNQALRGYATMLRDTEGIPKYELTKGDKEKMEQRYRAMKHELREAQDSGPSERRRGFLGMLSELLGF